MTTVSSDSIDQYTAKENIKAEGKIVLFQQHQYEMLDSSGVTKTTYEFLTKINTQEAENAADFLQVSELTDAHLEKIEEEMKELDRLIEKIPLDSDPIEQYELKETKVSPLPTLSIKKEQGNCEEKKNPEVEISLRPAERALPKDKPIIRDLNLRDYRNHDHRHPLEQRASFADRMHRHESSKAPFFMIPPKRKESIEKANERKQHTGSVLPQRELHALLTKEPSLPEREGREQRGGREQQQQQQQQQQQEQEKEREHPHKKELKKKIGKIEGSVGTTVEEEQPLDQVFSSTRTDEVGDIFVRFMALMARILGQAQADAHMLYQRIKERTDNIDVLTHLLSKINTTNKKIDWSKDEQMKALVDQARTIGVEIPEGKYTWTEDEKRYLKENIQMRKDTMEKVTQLERTDMQRFMQEASQCHQARSNVLKLIKEVMDTIISNLRGH